MKLLFVCRQNIGRSQMAKALYNQLHPDTPADAAGTIVDKPGQTLRDAPAPKTIAAMQEVGIDVSGQIRRQLTPDMLEAYDRIVVMAEPQTTPEWLKESPKAIFWDVPDPKVTDQEGARRIRDMLEKLVATL